MAQPSIAYPIDSIGRILISDAADKVVATASIAVTATAATTLTTNTSGLKRRKLLVRNTKSGTEVVVFIGDATVTATTGLPLCQNDELTLDVDDSAVVKAIRGSGAIDGELRIMEIE